MRRFLFSFVSTFAALLINVGSASAQELTPPPAIAPPPPMDPSAPGAPGHPHANTTSELATRQKLDEAEQADSGRNFEVFWVDAFLGGSYINLSSFSSD